MPLVKLPILRIITTICITLFQKLLLEFEHFFRWFVAIFDPIEFLQTFYLVLAKSASDKLALDENMATWLCELESVWLKIYDDLLYPFFVWLNEKILMLTM